MVPIKFGTEGWRAIIAEDFTVENVKRIAEGTAKWMQLNNMSSIVIGYDTRFGGLLFSNAASRVFCAHGIIVLLAKDFVTTPMLCVGVLNNKADIGLMITASHNASEYNGFKLKSDKGGPIKQALIEEIEDLVPTQSNSSLEAFDFLIELGKIKQVDLEEAYYQKIISEFNLPNIKSAQLMPVYDAMYGAGQKIFIKVIPESLRLHCDYNPSFGGTEPEPIPKNITLLGQMTASTTYTCCGIATDGDADRIGLYDERGFYVDAHKTLLLLIYYLCKYKGQKGKVIISSTISEKVELLAGHFGLEVLRTKVGFKHYVEHMSSEDFLIAGEESGGFAFASHIPDRDGIWSAFMILECIAASRKYISELLTEIYLIVGTFEYDREDLSITREVQTTIIDYLNGNQINEIGGRSIIKSEQLDGHKYYFDDDEWVMVRASGNEPKLRIYAQSKLKSDLEQIISNTKKIILNLNK